MPTAEAALNSDLASTSPAPETPGAPRKKMPLLLKVYGILLIAASVISIPLMILLVVGMVFGM